MLLTCISNRKYEACGAANEEEIPPSTIQYDEEPVDEEPIDNRNPDQILTD